MPDDPIKALDAVLFDLGNTLFYLDYGRLLASLARHGLVPPTLTEEDIALAERRARPGLSRYLEETRASTEDPRTFHRYLGLALEQAGWPPDPQVLDLAFGDLCRESASATFFSRPAPGALEAVRTLSSRFRVGVISNGSGLAREKLAATGFLDHLLLVLDSGLVGVEKPDPRIVRMACDQLRVEPARALYVGDLHAIDVLGARGAGLHAALLDPAGAYADARLVGVDLYPDVAALAKDVFHSTTLAR